MNEIKKQLKSSAPTAPRIPPPSQLSDLRPSKRPTQPLRPTPPALAKSLEAYKIATDTNINAKFWSKDVEKVHAEGYVYHGEVTYQRFLTNNGIHTKNPNTGTIYTSFDKFMSNQEAIDKLQLLAEWGHARPTEET